MKAPKKYRADKQVCPYNQIRLLDDNFLCPDGINRNQPQHIHTCRDVGRRNGGRVPHILTNQNTSIHIDDLKKRIQRIRSDDDSFILDVRKWRIIVADS